MYVLNFVKRNLMLLLTLVIISRCSQEKKTLFLLVPLEKSGLDFQNTIEETDSLNILTVDYMYHGGGVAIGDFNNDGLKDIFFTGNIVSNKLFLNLGNLKFQDITLKSGIAEPSKILGR